MDSNGFPLYLLTAVDELSVVGCHWAHGWTLIQPIDRSGSAPVLRANGLSLRSFLVVVAFQIVFVTLPVNAVSTKNAVFIVVDDLRPDLGAYGQDMSIYSRHRLTCERIAGFCERA